MLRRCFTFLLLVAASFAAKTVLAHDIIFCGEVIPVSSDFVATKLMDVIRRQIPMVNLPALRQRALQNFPNIENVLRAGNIPLDFKYLPIVESAFLLQSSRVGARGFWQLMPKTAIDEGLKVTATLDERDDISKSTRAAANVLVKYFNMIQKKYRINSWVLTAAAYNFGIGNIYKAIDRQGANYFAMQLNPETAVYVYKIIAVKELFEYPELYMKDFGYNVFAAGTKGQMHNGGGEAGFDNLTLKVGKKKKAEERSTVTYIGAHIKGNYKSFEDGDLLKIELDQDLVVQGGYTKKGTVMKGTGWIIDGRLFVDLSYGHDVLLYDDAGQKGIELSALKNNKLVLLKNSIAEDYDQWGK